MNIIDNIIIKFDYIFFFRKTEEIFDNTVYIIDYFRDLYNTWI
jgi:hypothetical protein